MQVQEHNQNKSTPQNNNTKNKNKTSLQQS